ncbi:hypothetical protein EJD97_004696, partial [Solanum chilense]
MKGYDILSGMPWHLTDDVYVPVNRNGEFHWVLAVVALKERCIKVYDFMSSNTNVMAPVKRKLDIDTSDQTNIHKKARSKIARKRNENTTLLANLATKAASSSQAEVEFCQKKYEQRKVMVEEDRKQEEVEEQRKINEVQEEEGKHTEVVVVAQQEKINEVHEEEQELHEDFNASDIEAFKNYPWGHKSFHLTVDYLLRPLGEKTSNLFGFTWAFMVVYLWITPTEEELQMSYLITLGLVETIFDPVVDRVKMVLVGATTIKRDQLHNEVANELVVFYGAGVGPGGAGAGVGVGVGVVAGADAGQHDGNTSCRPCSAFLCESVRNMMKILSCILKNSVKLSM